MMVVRPGLVWLLWLVPLFIGLIYVTSLIRRRQTKQFVSLQMWAQIIPGLSVSRRFWRFVFLSLGLVSLIIVLMGPQWGREVKVQQREGLDILIAADVSKSMLAQDVFPSRFVRSKQEIKAFVDRLAGDRVGLLSFSGKAVMMCPFTTDYSAVKLFVDDLRIGQIPQAGTQIGDVIKLARSRFKKSSATSKIVILLTDGETFDDSALDQAEKAGNEGIRVFAVGFGSDKGEPIPLINAQGQRAGYKKDLDGNIVLTRLNSELLNSVASLTGGQFISVQKGSLALDQVYRILSQFEKNKLEDHVEHTYKERFQIPAFFALLFLALDFFISPDRRRRSLERWSTYEAP